MSEPLKPCPGCGAKARDPYFDESHNQVVIYCKNPNCSYSTFGGTPANACDQWQHRTPGPATKKILEQYAKHITETAKEMDQGQGFDHDTLAMVQDMKAFIAEWTD